VPRRSDFQFSDAWILASLSGSSAEGSRLAELISAADVLNRAIPTAAEIRGALTSLHRSGLVEVSRDRVRLTEHGAAVVATAGRRRGGLFQVVGNVQDVLNSPRTRHPEIDGSPDLSFVTQQAMDAADREYRRKGRGEGA
jgi:hypothetical protein